MPRIPHQYSNSKELWKESSRFQYRIKSSSDCWMIPRLDFSL
ncbi:unnamed protein product [Nippostrongylus brasiliensis]|uniref:Uncharacterized protein n=1 Tax=Nippostrongylus brasiliensis TaxID=27835 RepID=A0A0N4XE25_NIPBR|nr:unnamed protein product [Nippostrongylus brasiliensis]